MRTRRRALLVVGTCAVMLSGCQLRIATDVVVLADGSGTLELAIGLDEELSGLLTEAGLDPLRDVSTLATAAPEWEISSDEGSGLDVRLRTSFADAETFAARTDDLHAALSESDGRIFRDLRLGVTDDRVSFSGEVGLLPPLTPGATGDGVAFDAEDLAALLAERGDQLIRYDLRVTLPGSIREHDADQADGPVLTWSAPIGELRAVSAVADIGGEVSIALALGVGAAVGAVASLAIVMLRARRTRRAGSRA